MKRVFILYLIIVISSPALFAKNFNKSAKMINDILHNNREQDKSKPKESMQNERKEREKSEAKGENPKEDEVLHKTGMELFDGGFYNHAAGNFNELVKKFPQSPYADNANIFLGKIEIKKFRYQQALKYLEKINSQSGEYPTALFYKAIALKREKNTIKSLELFKKISASFPDHELSDNALLEEARAYIKLNKGQKALEAIMDIIKKYENRETIDDAFYMLGYIYLKDRNLRDIERTVAIYKTFLKKSRRGDSFFKNSPLLPVIKKELTEIEKFFFENKQ